MKTTTLLLEHRQGGRVLKRLRLTSVGRPLVIGTNKKADIRLMGADVSPFHAVIEFRKGSWYIFDFSSSTGTWINKNSINEFHITSSIVAKIGEHELYLQPVEPRRDLFEPVQDPVSKIDNYTHHQIILRNDAGIMQTHLLPRVRAFKTIVGNQVKEFAAPQNGNWVSQKVGNVVIQQRLVNNPGAAKAEVLTVDKDMKWPLFATAMVSLVLALLIGFKPTDPDQPKVLPEMNNKYASMIYNAKVLVEKRKESNKVAEKKFAAAPNGSAGGGAEKSIPKGGAATKLISQVKATGLSQLIGKIAKRTASNATLLSAVGTTSEKGEGRSVAALSATSLGKVGTAGSSDGKGFKLQGIGTTGKGGGGDYKSGTGLGIGGVGSANVGVIEEEAEVGGGLDKDVIAEIIKSELGQIRYCYERQLSAHPELYGKILVKFTIGLDGAVAEQRVGTTTLKNADVEGCILRRVARWKFPMPKGGTSVLVTYPFLFKSTN